jgi:hypothetical protein
MRDAFGFVRQAGLYILGGSSAGVENFYAAVDASWKRLAVGARRGRGSSKRPLFRPGLDAELVLGCPAFSGRVIQG